MKENDIKQIDFNYLNLCDVGKAQFMRRIDSKYLVQAEWAFEILSFLKQHYFIVENKEQLMPEYFSEYFDSSGFTMYLDHHNRRAKRYKVRLRHYKASGDVFLEVKTRMPSGETLKKRTEITNNSIDNPTVEAFVKKNIPFRFNELTRTLYTTFNRITLVSFDFNERVTMDFNIMLKNPTHAVNLSNICVIESKRDKYNSSSFLIDHLKQYGYRQTGFSKYSIGCALLYNNLKSNNFKPIITHINKYKNENALVNTTS